MIVHVFNSSVVSGPETLVIPSLKQIDEKATIIFLSETRNGDRALGPPTYARSFGFDTLEVVVRSRLDFKAVEKLHEMLKRLAPRIVHAHEVKAAAYVALASRGPHSYRLVTTNHGVRAKKILMLRIYEWIFTHLVMRKFDRVLCVCTSDRDLLIREGVSKEKIRIHLNGVDRPKISPEKRTAESARIRKGWGLASLGVSEKAICLGLVGRLAPEKRHSHILHSFKILRERYADLDVHLVIFGIGALEANLIAETNQLKLEDRVHWMGYRGTVGAESAGFDLLLSLSFAEGLPINILEAGWAGTPVFATAVDGNLDLVPTAEYGTVIDPQASEEEVAERLARELNDRQRLVQTGGKLQERVERYFSGTVWTARLQEIYAELR